MSVIVIDPGHGGEKKVGGSSPNNATGPSGTLEKHLTLDLARHAAAALKDAGHSVTLTRISDVNLGLAERAAVAKAAKADAFVSIHFNGFGDPQVQGTETWVHLNAGPASRRLAGSVQKAMLDVTRYRDRGVQSKTLGVLDPANHDDHTPACLAEVSFITSPADDRRLQDDSYKQALGKAIAVGIGTYLTSRARPKVAAARARARASAPTAEHLLSVVVDAVAKLVADVAARKSVAHIRTASLTLGASVSDGSAWLVPEWHATCTVALAVTPRSTTRKRPRVAASEHAELAATLDALLRACNNSRGTVSADIDVPIDIEWTGTAVQLKVGSRGTSTHALRLEVASSKRGRP